MTTNIPDFTAQECQLLNQILLERYGRIVPVQSADVELQLNPEVSETTLCPALYWNELGCEFVVSKLAGERFRCQFFYSANEQFGTGRDVYDSLGDCVITLLRVQADHARTRSMAVADLPPKQTPGDDDDYHGPVVI